MLRLKSVIYCTLMVLLLGMTANATTYYADTTQIGYTGTVTYNGTTTATSTPRNGSFIIKNDEDPGGFSYFTFTPDYTAHEPSNYDDSYFQIWDNDASSVLSSSGFWNSSMTEFSVNVTGANATFSADSSLAWLPDSTNPEGGTLEAGTWLDYELNLTATGMNPIIDNGWFWSDTKATSIVGSFTGRFTPDNTNFYDVVLTLSSALLDPTLSNYYFIDADDNPSTPDVAVTNTDQVIISVFGTPVPEPSTILLLGLGMIGFAGIARKKRI